MQPDSTKESVDIDNFMAWLHYNRKQVAVGATIIAVLLIAVALYNWNKNQKELNANAALFALPSLVGSKSTEVRAEDFQKVASEYPDTSVANRAELIAAGVLFTEGKFDQAEKQFAKYLDENVTSPLRSQAALGVAASLEAQNKISDAAAKYQQLITQYPGENVVLPAKLTLARLQETQNKPEEALKLYDELTKSQNPYDPWAAEARERRELLFQKFPNLKNKPVATTSGVSATEPVLNSPAPATPAASAPTKK